MRALACAALAVAALLCVPAPAPAEHSIIERLSFGPTGGNGAFTAHPEDTSDDGSAVLFSTSEQLVAADTDGNLDSYLRRADGTSLVTTGPAGGNGNFDNLAENLSSDGTRAVFQTAEPLTLDDLDTSLDVFLWSNGVTTRISSGPTGGNGPHPAGFGTGVSEDGTHVVFGTYEQLVPEDTDSSRDLYSWRNGTTTLVTSIPDEESVSVVLSRPSGDRIFVGTRGQLLPADTDASFDEYEYSGGALQLVTTGPAGGNAELDTNQFSISADGTKAVFSTREVMVAQDTDTSLDVYVRSAGTTQLVSTGPFGGNGAFDAEIMNEPRQPFGFKGVSDNGRIFFTTPERLVFADSDSEVDLHMRDGSNLTLVSAVSSGGNGPHGVSPDAISRDGRHAFFTSFEQISPEDVDTRPDLYEWTDEGVHPVSPPCLGTDPCGGPGPHLLALSDDGERVFFRTAEHILPGYPGALRVYERHGDHVTIVPGVPTDVILVQYHPSSDGSRLTFYTDEALLSADTDAEVDTYRISVGPGYPRPKGAAPHEVSLVPAYEQCNAGNRMHGPPLAFPSCNPPQQTSGWLTVGTPDANGRPPKAASKVKFGVLLGDPSTPADEADVRIQADINDVRNRSDLSDYTGQIRIMPLMRITDRFNGVAPGGGTDPATVMDIPFPTIVTCAATADTTVGATCPVDTTFEAFVPGAVKERQRAIWALGPVTVDDGGGDGDVATEPNTRFLTQGVFVP